MLASQSQLEKLRLVSRDPVFQSFKISLFWQPKRILVSNMNRLPSGAPVSWSWIKVPGAGFEAVAAAPLWIQVPVTQDIPVPSDQDLSAGMTVGARSLPVMDVAQIDMVDSVGLGNLPGTFEGRVGGTFHTGHFPVRMKRTEMQRNIRTQPFHHPTAQLFQFTAGIVVSRNEQGGQFEPDLGFMFEVFQGFQHRSQGSPAGFTVERFGESLEIDVCGIHPVEEFTPCLLHQVTRSDGYGTDPLFPAFLSDVHGIFQENHRVVVGVGDTAAAMGLGRLGNRPGGGGIGESIEFPGFADVPVLTETTGQVATCGAEGKDRGPGQEMIQRFLLHRIDAESARTPVGGELDLPASPLTHETQSTLSLTQFALPGADVAAQSPIFETLPMPSRMIDRHDSSLTKLEGVASFLDHLFRPRP